MTKIRYTGPNSKVIAGKHLFHGEVRDVNEKLVGALRSDPEIEILDEVEAPQVVAEEPAQEPEQAEPQLPLSDVKPEVLPEAHPVRRPRGKRK